MPGQSLLGDPTPKLGHLMEAQAWDQHLRLGREQAGLCAGTHGLSRIGWLFKSVSPAWIKVPENRTLHLLLQ